MTVSIQKIGNYYPHFFKLIKGNVGGYPFEEKIPILCPNSSDSDKDHSIKKNGRDTSTKANHQQYLCKDCNRSFYEHTSRYFQEIGKNIPEMLEEIFSGGRLSIERLALFFHVPVYSASRLMERFLHHAFEKMWDYVPFYEKLRNSSMIFSDETFLTIKGKTWYLTIVISSNAELMGFSITQDRKAKTISKLLEKCRSNLEHGLEILCSDGLNSYRTYAKNFGKDVIHVRHIHKKPYGWIEMEIYHYDHDVRYKTVIRTKNDIMVKSGGFIAEVRMTKEYCVDKKHRVKTGFNNYSDEAKDIEFCLKEYKVDKRRKKPENKKWKTSFYDFFVVDLKKGRVTSLDKNLMKIAARLEILLPYFAGKHITTNLIECENSIIKKCIRFGARRDIEKWEKYVEVYFAIRDQPKIIRGFASDLHIPKQMITKMSEVLIKIQV